MSAPLQQQQHHHARLVEHKLVVKNWNASTRQPVRISNRQFGCHQKIESEARMLQWLRGEQADRSLEECAVLSRGSLAYEESEVDSDDGRPDCEEEEMDVCPRTVGQIQHAYRSRARQEESAKNQRASEAARKQRERLKHKYQLPLVQPKDTIQRKATTILASSESAAPVESEQLVVSESDDDPDALHLDASALLIANGVYRENVLRGIRRQLSSGRNVLLTVSLSSLEDPFENLSEIKFALQQLCSESLLFCVRDQNVLASVDHQRGVVTLELLTRQPFSNMATLH